MQFCQMFEKVKKRWNVSNWQFLLIISTFAIGGSTCARVGKKLLDLLGLENPRIEVLVYLLLILCLWPICVILISIPLGQFRFFKSKSNYDTCFRHGVWFAWKRHCDSTANQTQQSVANYCARHHQWGWKNSRFVAAGKNVTA